MPDSSSAQTVTKPNQRLVCLDVVRGIVIAFMILVNNGGDELYSYWPLKHADWNGWTPTDLVFPSFVFMVGISIVLSTQARVARGEAKSVLLMHAFRRCGILIALGLIVHGFPNYPLATMRIYGVLQRIAICYLVATILYLWDRRVATLASAAAVCLLSYWIIMRWVPVPGFGLPGRDIPFLDKDMNLAAVIDRHVFPGRLYEVTRDPEGLLSTIPAIATCLLGVLTGIWLRTQKSLTAKAGGLLAGAVAGLALGGFWNIWFPINKKLWTSSFVLWNGGCTLLVLAICFFVIEIRKNAGAWTFPWKVFGSNAIVAYAISELLASVLESIHMTENGHLVNLKEVIYSKVFYHVIDPSFGSLAYAITFVLVCFIPSLFLFKKRIFIKI